MVSAKKKKNFKLLLKMLQGISTTYVGRERRASPKRSAVQRALQTRIDQIAKGVTVS